MAELPQTWRVVPLGTFDRGTRRTVDPAGFPNELFEYYSIPAYQSGQAPITTKGSEIASVKVLLEPLSVLFGKLNPRVEKVWRVRGTSGLRQIGSTEWLPLIPNGNVNPDFLYFLCWSDQVMHVAKGQVSGSTPSRQRVDPTAFYQIPVALPPLDEQRQIAAVLSAVQRAIERQERLIFLTAELKKVLMHKLFTEGTRHEPLKQSDVQRVPKGWRVEALGQHLAVAQYGLSVKGDVDGTTPILRMTNQVDGRIIANDLQFVNITETDRMKFRVEPGDILFNRTNSFDLVGRTAIFWLEGDFVFASYLIRLRTLRESLSATFLNHYFNWSATQARLKGIASRAVSQSNISASRLRGFQVPIPSLREQEEIAQILDQVDRVKGEHERKRLNKHVLPS